MNKKRTIVLIIGFISLVIFAIIVMAMAYLKNNETIAPQDKKVATYVAIKNIAAGQKITLNDIELRPISEEYAGRQPLAIADIVEHYASVDITANDIVRAEKVSLQSVSPHTVVVDNNQAFDTNMTNKNLVHDRISLPLSVFKNPDSTLHAGERLDIIGMAEYGDVKQQFATRYIALHVTVGGFMKDGQSVNQIASVIVDEKTKAVTKVFADEILLDMAPQEIGRFLSLYYRSQTLNNDRAQNPNNLYQGHIWMVKCNPVVSVGEEGAKQKMMSAIVPSRLKIQGVLSSALPPPPKFISAPKGIVSYEQ
jgi:hypothetical protein